MCVYHLLKKIFLLLACTLLIPKCAFFRRLGSPVGPSIKCGSCVGVATHYHLFMIELNKIKIDVIQAMWDHALSVGVVSLW